MCKFHKDVARDIATDPATGQFNSVAYSIALVALAKFWIDRYMPEMSDCDGYSNYAMAGATGVAAFEKSGLNADLDMIEANRDKFVGFVRDALGKVINEQGLTLQSLNLPKNPIKNSTFLDKAMVEIYDGDPAVELTLKKVSSEPDHEPLRQAVEAFYAVPGIENALQTMQEGSFARLFIEAREKANPVLLKAYERLPKGLINAFKSCAMCAGTGTGSAVLTHAGCVLVPVFAGASGSALSSQLMSLMLVTSPALAAGVTAGIDRLQGKGFSPVKVGASAALGFAIAFGINANSGHNHDHHHAESEARAQAFLDDMTASERAEFHQTALIFKKTDLELAADMCVAPDTFANQTPAPQRN